MNLELCLGASVLGFLVTFGTAFAADPITTQVDPDMAECALMLALPSAPTARASIAQAPMRSSNAQLMDTSQTQELLVSLSLSGGGYRAMLFHLGSLRRLNEAGLLASLSLVSSVSGGSIVSAYLAFRWYDLTFNSSGRATNFFDVVERPLHDLAGLTLDIPSVLTGLLPFTSAADRQVAHFDEHLFHGALLTEISQDGHNGSAVSRPRPLFIINATSLQTGELWQFRAHVMGGPITGWTGTDGVRLSQAVAASSGFPPFLSPLRLAQATDADANRWRKCVDYRDNPYGVAYANEPGRVLPTNEQGDYRRIVHLIDGGVRDNLGIAAIEEISRLRRLKGVASSTVTLISDGGAATALDSDPAANWASQALRVLNLLSDQPDEVRVSNIIRTGSLRLRAYGWNAGPTKAGCEEQLPPPELDSARRRAALATDADAYAYWSIRRLPKFHMGFSCPQSELDWMAQEVRALSLVPTAFRALSSDLQARLVNWGYLAAHHGLPYVDFAWPDPVLRAKWLAPCELPYGPQTTDPFGHAPSARHARCVKLTSLD